MSDDQNTRKREYVISSDEESGEKTTTKPKAEPEVKTTNEVKKTSGVRKRQTPKRSLVPSPPWFSGSNQRISKIGDSDYSHTLPSPGGSPALSHTSRLSKRSIPTEADLERGSPNDHVKKLGNKVKLQVRATMATKNRIRVGIRVEILEDYPLPAAVPPRQQPLMIASITGLPRPRIHGQCHTSRDGRRWRQVIHEHIWHQMEADFGFHSPTLMPIMPGYNLQDLLSTVILRPYDRQITRRHKFEI
ncbi:hypothetical protein TWF696_008494 [Orbilia brochopaga]|uniref:Uncharacterized protein n=1 Tax=Orbilia brochopaga TaxID=3140254 RepID=A0AAV9ULQ1_9PEZI